MSVIETWGYLSGTKCNPDNPNQHWNREDGSEIHGESVN